MPKIPPTLSSVSVEVYDVVLKVMGECLLENKHLYQSVRLNTKPVADFLAKELAQGNQNRKNPSSRLFFVKSENTLLDGAAARQPEYRAQLMFHEPWDFWAQNQRARIEPLLGGNAQHQSKLPEWILPKFSLPTIKIQCDQCDGVLPPHNPEYPEFRGALTYATFSRDQQLFLFPFQCQNCKKEPIFFMVRRDGLKLSLVGRSRFEKVCIPKYIPKEVEKYYEGAIVAFNTGHPLAGLFYLRTFLEQYMRKAVKTEARLTGDELGDLYAKTLPDDFQGRFASFKSLYAKVSEALHAAREDGELFQETIAAVEKHLEAKPFFMQQRGKN